MTTSNDCVLIAWQAIRRDGRGAAPRAPRVWVRGGRIGAVGPAATVLAEAGGRTGRRRCSTSAVASSPQGSSRHMHTHFSLALPGDLGHALDRMSAYDLALYMADGARRTLKAGVTTVRCVAERDGADFRPRAAIDVGRASIRRLHRR